MFEVSVIIPVYNAEKFITSAVESVVNIACVKEVILVEDGSPDGALAICKNLEQQYEKVNLYQHPNGENRGAGASRNLGITKAKSKYISFLDADDMYLPERFVGCQQIFEDDTIDYVFGISQLEDEYKQSSNKYSMMRIDDTNNFSVFDNLFTASSGYFDTNSITIKRSSIMNFTEWFDETLRLHQDSEFWIRIAYFLKGYPDTQAKPGAVVRRHENNRITHRNEQSQFKYWDKIKRTFDKLEVTPKQRKIIDTYYKYFQKVIKHSTFLDPYILRVKILTIKLAHKTN
jgi:glycosyltransferase involved in cell wall biosynthesis